MKITHHIPQEEYGYTEIEYEVDDQDHHAILADYPRKAQKFVINEVKKTFKAIKDD